MLRRVARHDEHLSALAEARVGAAWQRRQADAGAEPLDEVGLAELRVPVGLDGQEGGGPGVHVAEEVLPGVGRGQQAEDVLVPLAVVAVGEVLLPLVGELVYKGEDAVAVGASVGAEPRPSRRGRGRGRNCSVAMARSLAHAMTRHWCRRRCRRRCRHEMAAPVARRRARPRRRRLARRIPRATLRPCALLPRALLGVSASEGQRGFGLLGSSGVWKGRGTWGKRSDSPGLGVTGDPQILGGASKPPL